MIIQIDPDTVIFRPSQLMPADGLTLADEPDDVKARRMLANTREFAACEAKLMPIAVDDVDMLIVKRSFIDLAAEVTQFVADHDRYKEHSILLNQVSWRIAELAGKITDPAQTEYEGNVVDDLELLAARLQ